MNRSKLGQQRSQTALDRGRWECRDVGARSLDLRDDATVRAQPRPAAGASDVDA
jgi:hypothetical protein